MRLFLGLVLGLLLVAPSAHADEDFRVSGFGTFGFAHDNADRLGFFRNSTQPQREDNDFSVFTDSLLGIQANYRLHPEWELVGQLVGRQKEDTSLNSALEWAYVVWRPNAEIDLRFGRVGMDAFMLSDYRNVGFAQTWVRPPNEFYSWIPIYSIDGMDASYSFNTGDTHWQLKGQFGKSKSQLPTGEGEVYDFRADRARLLSLRATHGPWQFMGAVSALHITSEAVPPSFTNILTGIANTLFLPADIRTEAADLASGLWTKDATVRYNMLGVGYQEGAWQFQAEFAKISSDSPLVLGGNTAYAMLGYRFGKMTPYVIVSAFDPDSDGKQAQSDWSPLGLGGIELQTRAVAAYNTSRVDQRSISLGSRWDIGNHMDFKVQWDYKKVSARGYGLWQVNNLQGDGDVDRNVSVFSAVVDFTF